MHLVLRLVLRASNEQFYGTQRILAENNNCSKCNSG